MIRGTRYSQPSFNVLHLPLTKRVTDECPDNLTSQANHPTIMDSLAITYSNGAFLILSCFSTTHQASWSMPVTLHAPPSRPHKENARASPFQDPDRHSGGGLNHTAAYATADLRCSVDTAGARRFTVNRVAQTSVSRSELSTSSLQAAGRQGGTRGRR